MILLDAAAVAVCGISTVTDLLEQRILNVVTLPPILIGILYWAFFPGEYSHLWGLYGFLVLGVPFFLLYVAKRFTGTPIVGAGDVKLLMGIGAMMGFEAAWHIGLFTVVAAGMLSLVALVVTKRLGNMTIALRVIGYRITGRSSQELTAEAKPYKVPMGAAIAVGTVCQVFLQAFPLDG